GRSHSANQMDPRGLRQAELLRVTSTLRKAVFLDRDGVLIDEVGHLHRREDVRLAPGAPAAIRALSELGFLVIVITNQSAVARGLCSEDDLAGIHADIASQLAASGVRVDDWFYC